METVTMAASSSMTIRNWFSIEDDGGTLEEQEFDLSMHPWREFGAF